MASSLTDEQKIATVRAMADAWGKKDWRACADLLTENGAIHSMMKEAPMVGRDTFFEHMSAQSSPDKQAWLHIERIGVVGGAVVCERRDEIVVDGVRHFVPAVGILEFEGPLICLWREYFDRAQLLAAQGKTAIKS